MKVTKKGIYTGFGRKVNLENQRMIQKVVRGFKTQRVLQVLKD